MLRMKRILLRSVPRPHTLPTGKFPRKEMSMNNPGASNELGLQKLREGADSHQLGGKATSFGTHPM